MKVKIGFMEGAEEWSIKRFLGRFQDVDPSILEFEIDQDAPDYLIAFPLLYVSPRESYLKFIQDSVGKITVMDIMGEALAPNLNLFDYHIGFDQTSSDGRILYAPYETNLRVRVNASCPDERKDALSAKTGFCNYIYSHGGGHPYRIQLFSLLSEYKRVDSIGKHLNNTPCRVPRENTDWKEGSIMLKKPYKFSIACENAWSRGYTTEKIMTSFLADSIPVYWGNPLIEEEYNPKAFINCHRYHSLEEVVAEIKRIDEDDDLWMSIMSEPRQLPWQIEREHERLNQLTSSLVEIFASPLEQARRRGNGLWPDYYRNFFINNLSVRRKKSRREKLQSSLRKWRGRLFRKS